MGIPYYFYNLINKYNNILLNKINKDINIYCLDFNGIIHPIANEIINNNGTEEDIINKLWDKIVFYLNEYKPNKLVICIDGVAPIAKIIQQRKRRYLTKINNIKTKWDTNAISPGTKFMKKLNDYLNLKIKEYDNIILSDSTENGEGEHKIFDIIKKEDNETNIIINGLDADLIILSLLSKKNIILMRENKDELSYLSIKNLKIAILNELKNKWNLINENEDDIIESYCVMCFLLGNDFIPSLLTLNLKNNCLDKLINITGNSIKLNGLLVINNKINIECLKNILENLTISEDIDILNEINLYINKKINYNNPDSYGLKNKNKIIYEIRDNIQNWRNIYYKNIFNTNNNNQTYVINNVCNNYIKGIYWIYNYYKKINIDYEWYYPYNYPPSIKDISNYLKVNEIEEIKLNNKFLPDYIQLLLILPISSIDLIDDKYKKYMIDITKGLKHLYPIEYKIETFLKNHLWECYPILPTINIKRIENIIKEE